MGAEGAEKRKYPRVDARFIVSYRIIEHDKIIDITQTKNLSLGGILFTTTQYFTPGTQLAVDMRVPVDPNPVEIVGKVVDSCKVAKGGSIYNTRIEFLTIDEQHANKIKETINRCLSKKG